MSIVDGFPRWRRLVPLGLVVAPTVLAVWLLAARPSAAAPGDVAAQGRELYLTGCSSCHGPDGKGVTLADGTLRGPTLATAGEEWMPCPVW